MKEETDWQTYIRRYRVRDIVRVLGCSRQAVYYWRSGKKVPYLWVQKLVKKQLTGVNVVVETRP